MLRKRRPGGTDKNKAKMLGPEGLSASGDLIVQLLLATGELLEITPDQAGKIRKLHEMKDPPARVKINDRSVRVKEIIGVMEPEQISLLDKFKAQGLDISWMKR